MGGGDNEITISAILDTVGFQKGSKELQRAITGITASVKRMAASIVGAASVYQVLSKAVSTYMSQNQQLSAQIGAVWTALGNVLGPIINQLIGWVTTAVSYLLEFLRLLGITGKTASQLSKAANKAGGDLKRTIAGFDELNVLSKGGGGGGASGTLQDVDLEGWVTKLIELIKGKMWDDAADIIIEKLNGLIDVFKEEAGKLGTKIGEYFGGIVHIIARVLDEVNWSGIGEGLGAFFMGLTDNLNGEDLGKILISKITIAIDILTGFLSTEGLGERVATILADTFTGAFNSLADHIAKADWKAIGENIKAFFEKLWAKKDEIAQAIFKVVSAAWEAFLDLLRGLISRDDGQEPPLIGTLVKLGNSVREFAGALKTVWDEKIEPTLSALFNWAINEGLPKFFESLSTQISNLAKVLTGEISLSQFIADMDALSVVLGVLAAIKVISGLTALWETLGGIALLMPTIAPLVVALGALAVAIHDAATVSASAATEGFLEPGLAANEYAQNVAGLKQEYDQLQGTIAAYGPEAANDAALMNEQIVKTAALANAKQQLADSLGLTIDELNAQIEAAGGDVTQIEALTTATERMGTVTEQTAGQIKKSTTTHTDAIKKISETTDNVESSFGEGVGRIVQDAETGFGNVAGVVEQTSSDVIGQVGEMGSGALEGMQEMHGNVVGETTDMSGEVVNAFSDSVSGLRDVAQDATSDVADAMGSGMADVASDAYVWGWDMMVSLNNGIVAAFNAYVMPTIQQVAEYIRQYLGFSEPEKGPLSDFHTYGPDMMKLYAEGIEGNKKKVINAVSDVADGVSDAMSEDFALDKVSIDFEGAMDGFADKIVAGFESLVERLQVIADNVAFQMPAVAGGGVVPYGVYGGTTQMPNQPSDVSGLLEQLTGLVTDFRESVEHMQWVAKFGNIQAVVQEITKIQKQNERARG